jgi:hypothetical protein
MALHVGSSKNGLTVEVDLAGSHAAEAISRHPHLVTLAGEALAYITLTGERQVVTYDMGHTIGYDFVVETETRDNVFYAQLAKNVAYVPLTKVDKPTVTRVITMTFVRHQTEACYYMDDIYMGPFKPAVPGSSDESAQSKSYWQCHAYIDGNQLIRASTITRTSPY